LREDWIASHTVADAANADRLPSADEVIEYNAETFKGESV